MDYIEPVISIVEEVLSNVHSAGACGCSFSMFTESSYKAVIIMGRIRAGLTVHKYITASLSTGGENESDRDLRMVGAG